MKLLANADRRVAARRNPLRLLLETHADNAELRELILGRTPQGGWRYPCGVVVETLAEAKLIDVSEVGSSHVTHFRTTAARTI